MRGRPVGRLIAERRKGCCPPFLFSFPSHSDDDDCSFPQFFSLTSFRRPQQRADRQRREKQVQIADINHSPPHRTGQRTSSKSRWNEVLSFWCCKEYSKKFFLSSSSVPLPLGVLSHVPLEIGDKKGVEETRRRRRKDDSCIFLLVSRRKNFQRVQQILLKQKHCNMF